MVRISVVACAVLLACNSSRSGGSDAPPGTNGDAPASKTPDAPAGKIPDAPPIKPADAPPPPPDAPPPPPDAPPPPPPTGTTTEIYFPSGAPWTQDISTADPDDESAAIIGDLAQSGWGLGHLQIDFTITVLRDNGTAPMKSFTQWKGFFFTPDCDAAPLPVPAWGAIEGENGLACAHNGDCHLLVVEADKLYEMWRADVGASGFRGGCLAIWDRTRVYGPAGRGDGCTSADAAGYPISALLFNADEVKAGHIDHAIRFILPNDRIRAGLYVHPATHTTDTTGGSSAILYGARLRLRKDYPVGSLSAGAQVVARAMQKYGMFLADGGDVALTAESDRFTLNKWSDLLGPHDLEAIQVSDFAMMPGGTRVPTNDCQRAP